MKKYLFTLLAVLSMLAMRVGTAAAASANIRLVGVEHGSKGPVFTFSVDGKFSKGELKGSLHVENGGDYSLYCTQVDEHTVTCTTSDKVSGVNVVITWGGSTFWAFVPVARAPIVPEGPTQYCYSIWDYWEFTDGEWMDFGPYCQDTPAQQGDEITYTVPDPDGSFEFPSWFLEDGICPFWDVPNHGAGYYFCDFGMAE
jgi:hypothetical protein